MRAQTRFVLTLPLLLGCVHAQVVSPTHFRVAEAPSSETDAFGAASSFGWRLLQVHDDLAGQGRTFNSLALRRDSTTNRGRYNTYTLRMTVIVSTAATTAPTINANFDANHGVNKQTVVADRDIKMPITNEGFVPAPFEYRIPFDQGYAFNGAAPLCWEVRISNATNLIGSYFFDAASGASTNPQLAETTFGTGCQHSTQNAPASATGGSQSMSWSTGRGTLSLNGTELPNSTIAFALIGGSRTNYGALPLPFLFPGSLYAWSGPCNLYVSLELVSGVATTASGTARLLAPIPLNQGMHGRHVYGQFLAADPDSGNSLGLIASSGVEFNWVAPYAVPPVSQVFANQLAAVAGTVRRDFGYVIELR